MNAERGVRNAESNLRSWAIVALGSNLGDSQQTLREAMDRLQEFSDATLLCSSLWRSTPVDCPPGSADFVNAVVCLIPQRTETPESLLNKLQGLEREFGRQPKRITNEARPLDLDLIAFGSERRDSPELTLPHPRAHLRKFVLGPLAEIAPESMLPGSSETAATLLARLCTDERLERLT